jgi:hypothetical protein
MTRDFLDTFAHPAIQNAGVWWRKEELARDHEAWRAEMFSKGSMPLQVSKCRLDSVHSNIANLQSMGYSNTLFKCTLEC